MWLLDANVDVHLAAVFRQWGIPCDTAAHRGWKALSNGELVATAFAEGFCCLLTRDQLFGESAAQALRVRSRPRGAAMYKTLLVRELIEDGERLLQGLEGQGFPLCAALWYYVPERMMWKLVIVSDVAPDPLEAHMRIQQAMTALKGLSFALDDILVMRPDSRDFLDLRRTIEGVTRMAATRQRPTLEGVDFEDAHIYRWPTD